MQKGIFEYNNSLSFLYSRVKSNGFYNISNRILKYTRRYFLISRIIKYSAAVIAFIETSATLVLAFTALLIIIPVFILVTLGAVLFNITRYKKTSKLIEPLFEGDRKIYIFYSERGFFKHPDKYFNRMVSETASEGNTVLVVTRSVFHDVFPCAKQADKNIWVVRLNFFFYLKKKYLTDKTDRIITVG